jgi:hypothetical protein
MTTELVGGVWELLKFQGAHTRPRMDGLGTPEQHVRDFPPGGKLRSPAGLEAAPHLPIEVNGRKELLCILFEDDRLDLVFFEVCYVEVLS